MKIQYLGGGLANQIWHYAFVRFAERYNPKETWIFDDSWFFVVNDVWDNTPYSAYRRSLELERIFGLKLNLLSRYFEADKWRDIVRKRKEGASTPQILLDMGMPMVMFEGVLRTSPDMVMHGVRFGQEPFSGTIVLPEWPKLGFHPEYLDLPYVNVYYHGEWANKQWFFSYKDENRRELSFPEISDKQNLIYADAIKNSFSVGIHVRRGDFLLPQYSRGVSSDYYRNACKQVCKAYPAARFFIFSDELSWCMEHEKDLGFDLAPATYIEGNSGGKSYIDMQLLGMCRGIVRNAQSAFSQVAGWLDPNLEFEIKLKQEKES